MSPQHQLKNCFRPPAELLEEDVYVFASNREGHHTEGDAGWAFKGTVDADYHCNDDFKQIMLTEEKIGLYAIWGTASGMQIGSKGIGYALCVQIPLEERSEDISSDYYRVLRTEISHFISMAKDTSAPNTRWIIGPVGLAEAYGGMGLYDPETMAELWIECCHGKLPPNFIFSREVSEALEDILLVNRTSASEASITWVDLPPGSTTPNKSPCFYIGGLPGQESLLHDPFTKWEIKVGKRIAVEPAAPKSAMGRYRTYLLGILAGSCTGKRGAGKDVIGCLNKILMTAKEEPVTLVTVGEPSAAHAQVLVKMLSMRLMHAEPDRRRKIA